MAGFWYNLILNLINLMLGVVLSGVLLNLFYPFPESRGYWSSAVGVFVLYFRIFDLGTNMTMQRYIAEARIKDTQKMLHYIQYFIWYQMITGLIQTTTVSVYALYFVPETDLSYSVWLMLIASTTQFPGFLGVFNGILGSLQHFDKTAVISFIQGEIFQRITEAVFVLAGRYVGMNNPEIGEILGIAIGAAIGTYVDDFLGTIVAAHFFSKVMKSENIRARDCFIPDFNWKFIKDPFLFGVKTGLPGLIGGFTSMYILYLQITYLPQYATYATFVGMAGTLIWIIGSATPPMTALYSESFLNGKDKLAEYYLVQAWRYSGLILGFFMTVFLIVYMFLPDAFYAFNILYYMQVIPFILPGLIKGCINSFLSQASAIITGVNKPNYILWSNIVGQILNIFFMTMFMAWMQIQNTGVNGIIFVLVYGDMFSGVIMTIVALIYINYKVFRVRINFWQTFCAPVLSAGITFLVGYLSKLLIYNPLYANFGFYVALIPMILIFIVLGVFIYFPLTVFFGGWDKNNYYSFAKVVKMSGPSKFLVAPMYKIIAKVIDISPLYNKFIVDATEATIEAEELLLMKKSS
jgi:O-antigen/teichoic acid export membrane protein